MTLKDNPKKNQKKKKNLINTTITTLFTNDNEFRPVRRLILLGQSNSQIKMILLPDQNFERKIFRE